MARAITPTAALQQIKAGTPGSLYLLLGDDEHEKIELAAEFEGIVDESLRAFNVERFHGGDVSLGTILDAARTVPMMADRRVVVVTRAERVLEPARESASATRDAEAMQRLRGRPAGPCRARPGGGPAR